VERPYFEERTGISLNKINGICERLIAAGLLENSPSHIVTTKKGHRFLNTVLCYFSE
jgi:coproporphyrinogen III oxidase-like Fe-S oxidoreductase